MFKKQAVVLQCLSVAFVAAPVFASEIPSNADASRITMPQFDKKTSHAVALLPLPVPKALPRDMPDGAESVAFTLSQLQFYGITAFSDDDVKKLYVKRLNKKISLSEIYVIADELTALYRDKGYFLSRAFVPEQSIEGGVVAIHVVEGYIGQIRLDKALESNRIAKDIIEELKGVRPVRIADLESTILKLNDIPALSSQGVLYALDGGDDGAVGLEFKTVRDDAHHVAWTGNNYGSRYIGAYQNTISYAHSFVENQLTQIAGMSTLPMSEMRFGSIRHTVMLSKNNSISLFYSGVKSAPGASLERQRIRSKASEVSMTLDHQLLRSKQMNAGVFAGVARKNLHSNLFSTIPLTRDTVYSAQLGVKGDVKDGLGGLTSVTLTATHGLDILNASQQHESTLSREDASPRFAKLELFAQRQDYIFEDVLLINKFMGQLATSNLFSSEEFGFGGQVFGRSYDASEFTGENGVAGSVELHYDGGRDQWRIPAVPFVFYDMGYVRNRDDENEEKVISSIGFGSNLTIYSSFDLDATVAWPLLEDIRSPHYASNRSPRFLFQLGYDF